MRALLSITVGFLLATTAFAYEQYNETLSKRILFYASATFCNENDLKYWACGPACQALPGVYSPVTILSEIIEGTFGFAAYNNLTNNIVVAFRGSDNTANWIEDGDYFLKPYPYGPKDAQVHGGFYDAYYSLSSQVIAAVNTYLNEHPDATIIVTGHSLGAAMSTFAALDIKQ